jgi:hypothetical protein
MFGGMCVQIAGKWKYAAMTYRAANPGVLPPEKTAPGCPPSTRLLPIEEAKHRMDIWVPWAIQKIIRQGQAMQKTYAALDPELEAKVDQEPEEEVLENEEL